MKERLERIKGMLFLRVNIILPSKKRMWNSGVSLDMCIITCVLVMLLWGLPLSRVDGTLTITRPEGKANVSKEANVTSGVSKKHVEQGRICGSVDIRNSARQLEQLRGCTVVEGFVHIVLIDHTNESDYDNISFPELREITCYLVFYRVRGLRNLGQLFPNLAVIRGNTLVKDYALVVYEMLQLQELGLWRLTAILRGSVRIERNYALCYYNTVNWEAITNDDEHVIDSNKDAKSCPGRDVCDVAEGCNKNMCWGSQAQNCHRVPPPGECHELCLGGCSGPGADQCYVCRGVLNDGECVSKCPPDRYSFLGRRCVEESRCQDLQLVHQSADSLPAGEFGGTRGWAFNGSCVVHCPPGYEKIKNSSGAIIGCEPCQGRCSHECEGSVISSISDAQNLRGCTIIRGGMEIFIRGSGNHIVRELEENLADIEEIWDYLKVSRSFPLTSLNFLKNLRVIHGNHLEDERYSLIVIENQNLQELWNWTSRPHGLKILNGSLRFHYNPKLCLTEIDKLQQISGAPNYTNFDVARESNGDKVACNVVTLHANATVRSSTSVQIEWEPCLVPDPSYVLGYVVYYIVAPERNITEHDGLDACGNNGWRVIDVPYDPDENITISATQPGNLVQFLPHLEPFTQYAFYVKTYTKSNTGGQSRVKYFRTLPDRPSVPKELHAFSNSTSNIFVQWLPPEHPNGILTHYLVSGVWQHDDQDFLEQRNCCEFPLDHNADPDILIIPSSTSDTLSTQTCCGKAESEYHVLIQDEKDYYKVCGAGHKRHKILDASGVEIDPCRDYFYSFVHTGIPELRDEEEEYTTANLFPDFPSSASFPQKVLSTLNHTIMNDYGVYERFLQRINASTTQILLDNLQHFAEYTISIFACHEPYISGPNKHSRVKVALADYESCGPAGLITVRTKYLVSADKINFEHLGVEVSNGTSRTVRLTWKEPKTPNGLVVAYRLEHRRMDSGTLNPIVKCLSTKEYLESGGGYILNNLSPGNYSYRVRATSLAGDGPFTNWSHFSVEELPVETSMGSLVGVLVGGLLVLVGFAVLAMLWWRKRAVERNLMIIASVNPEYMSAGDVIYVEDEWEVARDKVKLLRELGQGSFGMVYEGLLKPGDVHCAVKMINESASMREKMEFLNEASMMKSFAGANHVVNLLAVVSKGQPALVIMELMARGDLKTYLRQSREPPPPPPDIRRMLLMAAQIADGMAYLEAHKFVHRDLAARNCMVAENLTIKIGDFGMTRDIYETDYYRNGSKGLLPVRWMSPESLADGVFTSQSDVWSFGVVLWEMSTLAEQPYQGLANEQVLQFVLGGGVLDRPLCCPDILHQFMVACWQRRPSRRPRFLQIVADLEEASDLGQQFQQISFYHSKEGQDMKAHMIQQQNLSMSCETELDDTFMSSPPVSFYQLLEDETVPLEGKTVQPQAAAGTTRTSHVNPDDSYVLPGNLRGQPIRDPNYPHLGMKYPSAVTVPNRRDVSDNSYVLPGSLMGPQGRYVSGHLSEISETESLLPNTNLEYRLQAHGSPEVISPNRVSQTVSSPVRRVSQPILEDGYVPAENVYVQPDTDTSAVLTQKASSSCGRTSYAEPEDGYVPADHVLSQPTPEASRVSAVKTHSYVPTGNVSVNSDVNSRVRLPGSSRSLGRHLSAASSSLEDTFVPSEITHNQPSSDNALSRHQIPRRPSNSVPDECDGYVPADSLKGEGDIASRRRPPNGMVNGYISLPQDQDDSEYVPPFN